MSGHTEYKRLQETDLEEGLTAVELQGRDAEGKTVAVPLYDISGKEDKSNKKTTLTNSDEDYPTTKAVRDAIAAIQATRPVLNTNFNTNDLIDGLPQYGKEINLQNTSNIEITVKAGTFSTYFKGGAGTIKFVADTGRTLKLMDATDTINGIVGSYAKVKSFGTVDYIYINNYS